MLRREKPRPPFVLDVLRTEEVAEGIVRIVLGGPTFDTYEDNGFADRYAKLLFAPPGVTYDDPTDIAGIREQRPPEEHPRSRTYTIRWWHPEDHELAIDFVLHGDAGIAAPWAASARPGDRIVALGPGGAYRPDPTAAFHLFVADDAALPAVAAALDELPDDAEVFAVIALDVVSRASYLGDRFADRIQVIDRSEGPALDVATAALTLPDGDGQAFVHTELSMVRPLKAMLRDRFEGDRLSLSGYWREGKDEDGFQAEKRTLAEAARSAS